MCRYKNQCPYVGVVDENIRYVLPCVFHCSLNFLHFEGKRCCCKLCSGNMYTSFLCDLSGNSFQIHLIGCKDIVILLFSVALHFGA